MTNEEAIKWLNVERQLIVEVPQDNSKELKEAYDMAIQALESQRYKPIILQEHDAEPRTMRAILDTETEEIYVCKLTRQGAEIYGMTIEEVRQNDNADDE